MVQVRKLLFLGSLRHDFFRFKNTHSSNFKTPTLRQRNLDCLSCFVNNGHFNLSFSGKKKLRALLSQISTIFVRHNNLKRDGSRKREQIAVVTNRTMTRLVPTQTGRLLNAWCMQTRNTQVFERGHARSVLFRRDTEK